MSDTQKHTKSNVPNLRFPGFEGKWKNVKIKDVCRIATGNKNTQDKEDDGRYPFYVRSQKVEHINSWTFDGDAILTAGDGVGVGKVFHYSTGKIGVHQRVYILSDFKCNGRYLFYYFSSRFFDRVKRMSAKNSVDSVRMEMIAEMPLALPDIEEQIKIGILLSMIDERIAIQNKVIEKYESLIKALAHEIIGKHASNIMLSECVHCASSTLKESDLAEAGAVPAYGAAGISGFTDSALSDGDSILITKDGSGVGSLRYVSGLHSFVGTLNSMTPKDGIYLPYIYYALQNVCFETYRTGQAIPHIYFRDYGKEAIYCPAYDDQKRLAKRLELLDAKIGIERAVLRNLQSAKAFLLSGMFI